MKSGFTYVSLRLQNARYLNFKKEATCSHLQPLAATRSHSQTLAATCSHSSGRKWPLGGRKWPLGVSRTTAWQPLAATCSHSSGRKWLQVAASGCEWPQAAVGASGCKCPQVAAWIANPCPEGHVPQNLKKSIFLQTGFFSSLPCNI